METGFWLGLLFSIPISILANLFTPTVQAWLDARNRKRSLERTKNLQQEYYQVKQFREDRSEFREYLIWIVIRTTFVGSLVGILASFVFAVPSFFDILDLDYEQTRVVRNLLYAAGQFVSLVGGLLIVNLCSSALKVYYRVKNFEAYEESINQHVPALVIKSVPTEPNVKVDF